MGSRGGYRPRAVKWSGFDPNCYPTHVIAVAVKMWRDLARGEYFSIDTFSRFASGLALAGAPLDLVAAATRIASDEARHADHALHMLSLLTADVRVDIPTLEIERRDRLPRLRTLCDLDRAIIDVPTFGETLACGFLTESIRTMTDPVVRSLYRSLLADEVRHARFGWYYLAWRAPQWSSAERQRAADHAGEIVIDAERTFSLGWDVPASSLAPSRALGIVDSGMRRETVVRVMEEEIVPAYDALGLGASHAWQRRRRPSSQ